jgi:hypothetical protein
MQQDKYDWTGGDPALNAMLGQIDWSSIPGINTTDDKRAAIEQFMITGMHPVTGQYVGSSGAGGGGGGGGGSVPGVGGAPPVRGGQTNPLNPQAAGNTMILPGVEGYTGNDTPMAPPPTSAQSPYMPNYNPAGAPEGLEWTQGTQAGYNAYDPSSNKYYIGF